MLSDNQLTILQMLYSNADRVFDTTELSRRGIKATKMELNGLAKQSLISLRYLNEANNKFSITPAGQAYYEQHLKLKAEEHRHEEHEEKILAASEKSNSIAEDANGLSKTANKYSVVALIVSIVSAVSAIASVIITLLKN